MTTESSARILRTIWPKLCGHFHRGSVVLLKGNLTAPADVNSVPPSLCQQSVFPVKTWNDLFPSPTVWTRVSSVYDCALSAVHTRLAIFQCFALWDRISGSVCPRSPPVGAVWWNLQGLETAGNQWHVVDADGRPVEEPHNEAELCGVH